MFGRAVPDIPCVDLLSCPVNQGSCTLLCGRSQRQISVLNFSRSSWDRSRPLYQLGSAHKKIDKLIVYVSIRPARSFCAFRKALQQILSEGISGGHSVPFFDSSVACVQTDFTKALKEGWLQIDNELVRKRGKGECANSRHNESLE